MCLSGRAAQSNGRQEEKVPETNNSSQDINKGKIETWISEILQKISNLEKKRNCSNDKANKGSGPFRGKDKVGVIAVMKLIILVVIARQR